MRLTLALVALPLVLAGCALTPRQSCEWPHRQALGVVNQEIAATQTALRRGYVLAPATFPFGLRYCLDAFGNDRICRSNDDGPFFDRRRINPRAEEAKLAALFDERQRLGRELARCAAQFPE